MYLTASTSQKQKHECMVKKMVGKILCWLPNLYFYHFNSIYCHVISSDIQSRNCQLGCRYKTVVSWILKNSYN
jgi:hypothetical protein